MAQNHFLVVTNLFFFGEKAAADCRHRPERVEKVRGDESGHELFGLGYACQVHVRVLPYCDLLVRPALRFPIEIVGRGSRAPNDGFLRRKAENRDQAVKVGQSDWLFQECNGHAEDRRVRPNAQGPRDDRGGREAGILEEHSEAVTRVLKRSFDEVHATSIAAFFPPQFESVHRPHGRVARVLWGHALSEEFFAFALKVVLKLFVELLLDALSSEERAQPQQKRMDPMFEVHGFLLALRLCKYRLRNTAKGSRPSLCYSSRRATVGSTRVARRTGIQQATSVTAARIAETLAYVAGSKGGT